MLVAEMLMFFLDWLFGKRQARSAAAAPAGREDLSAAAQAGGCAPGTSIRYSPELIDRLVRDHRSLFDRFGAIRSAAREGRLKEAEALLDRFRADLHDHLLVENVRLYVYLEHALANDPVSHALIREFRHDMDEIGRNVVAFLARYAQIASSPALAEAFVAEFDVVGKVLADRIKREEEVLYPLYAPVG
ncbi:hemerythrin HHE cation binding domain-containing protein [Thauera sp. 27]|nr:hemerythrin HHE cation binding domain-containing protein [Thauera sp. 27]